MKRYLLGFLFVFMTITANAAWHVEADGGCAVYVRFLGKDDYYFCGAHQPKCNEDWAESNELKSNTKWFKHKEPVDINGSRYYCCDGQITGATPTTKKGNVRGTVGRFVKGSTFFPNEGETKIKDVAGGKCSYTETRDICGYLHSTEGECTAQAADKVICPDGQYYRESSGSCATLCKPGYAYESEKSNRCVECSETATQGIVSDTGGAANANIEPEHRICRTCPSSTSVFNPETGQCIPKPQLTALSTTELQYGRNGRTRNAKPVSTQCWTKFGTEYKDCVLNNK